ncbi:MAG: Flp family type IVb pilin [Pirellulales bacterium]
MKRILYFLRAEDGPTAVEYAVMLSLIILACFASITSLVNATADSYNDAYTKMDAAINGGGS